MLLWEAFLPSCPHLSLLLPLTHIPALCGLHSALLARSLSEGFPRVIHPLRSKTLLLGYFWPTWIKLIIGWIFRPSGLAQQCQYSQPPTPILVQIQNLTNHLKNIFKFWKNLMNALKGLVQNIFLKAFCGKRKKYSINFLWFFILLIKVISKFY